MSGRNFRPLFTWRSAICDSDLRPTLRHVALTLSLHMNERGGSCFPSQETLSAETGLNEQTIKKSLQELAAAGWVGKEHDRSLKGRGTITNYQARYPTTGSDNTGSQDCDHRCPEDPTTGSEDTPPVEDVIRTTRGRQGVPFDDFYLSWPKKRGKDKAKKLWAKLSEPDREAAIQAVSAWKLYAQQHDDGNKYVPQADTWLRNRSWEDEDKPTAGNPAPAKPDSNYNGTNPTLLEMATR